MNRNIICTNPGAVTFLWLALARSGLGRATGTYFGAVAVLSGACWWSTWLGTGEQRLIVMFASTDSVTTLARDAGIFDAIAKDGHVEARIRRPIQVSVLESTVRVKSAFVRARGCGSGVWLAEC